MSLKRSSALDGAEQGDILAPDGIRFLETLTIFGWNANYIQAFRQITDAEDVGREFVLPVRKMTPWPAGHLPLPQTPPGFDAGHLVWPLNASGPQCEVIIAAVQTPRHCNANMNGTTAADHVPCNCPRYPAPAAGSPDHGS